MKTQLLAIAGVIALASLLHFVDCAPVNRRKSAKALKFLVDFGYLNKSQSGGDSGGGSGLDSEPVIKAISNLQKFGNLAVTGKLNDETLQLLATPRCGREDPFNKLKPAGKKSGDLSVGEYYLQGTRWKKLDLTYRFISFTNNLGREEQKSILRRMIQKWAEASTLTITEAEPSVPDDDVDILIKFVRRYHNDPYPFDGQGGTLAHAYYPHNNKGLSGDAHFDDDEPFTTGTSRGINLDWVAVHEFGHSMGLEHSNVRESIMYPWYKGYLPNIELTYDDIQGIQALYGKPTKVTPRPPTDPKTKTPTPTPTPAPTDPPTAKPETPKPDVHLACRPGMTYDAVVVEVDSRGTQFTHFFQGHYFFTLTRRLQRGGAKKVKDYFPHVRTPVDAAYRNKQGNIVFFTGSRFCEYGPAPSIYNKRRQPKRCGYISQYGLSSEVSDMDALFTWQRNKKTYIFKGSQYWRYNEHSKSMDRGYPKPIRQGWPNLPNDIDAAVTWSNGKSYVFDGRDYLRLKSYSENRKVYVDPGYPKDTAQGWMKCKTDSIGALAIGALAGGDP